MCRTILGAALLTIGMIALPLCAADEKGEKKPAEAKKDNPYVNVGQLVGVIESVEESKRSLRIDMKKKMVDPIAKDAYVEAMKALRKARTQQERIAAAQQVQSAQMKLYTNVLELQTTDDVVVRVAQPPAQFDEKGRVKKYTAKELRELKGNTKLPGYSGEFSNLRQRQIVQVTLVKKKEAMRARGAKGKDADTGLLNDNLPMVGMVIVLRDLGN